jgi:predicted O-methyltransferase YrrM
VSRLSKSLTAIFHIIRNPWLLNKVLEDDILWRNRVSNQYKMPEGLPVIAADELFGDFTETIDPFAFLDGGSLPTDLALLKKLACSIPHCCYFEIGTWRGESVANVASVAEKCYTLNLSDEEMRGMGMSERYIGLHRFFSRDLPNVIHLEGNTLDFEFQSLNRRFDLVFIDGDHRYDMVKNDTQKVLRHLVHDKSLIVWHDYARNPETVRFEVLAGILDGSPESLHRNLFHVANTLCAVYLPGRTGGQNLESPVKPEGSFRIEIKFNKGDSISQDVVSSDGVSSDGVSVG